MRDIINKWVKHREDSRPFAPSIVEENVEDFFEDLKESPFILFIAKVKSDKRRKLIPAVIHIDGTARPQTVARRTNPLFWQPIKNFEKIKGFPIVLNTSFNVKGEPMVCTPTDAIRCFFGTGIDCLIMGNYLLRKHYHSRRCKF